MAEYRLAARTITERSPAVETFPLDSPLPSAKRV